jgi:hypothetical protein
MPVEMHYREDEHAVILDGVNDALRKTVGATPSDCFVKELPCLGLGNDA